MALVTQSVIVVLLCALSQCNAAGTVSFSSGSASQIVMEGGTLSVCLEAILDPGDSVQVGLSSTLAVQHLWMAEVTLLIIIMNVYILGELYVPMNTLQLSNSDNNCWIVTATDDEIYEVDSKIFTLTLTLVNPSSPDIVLTDPSTATITVMDDEGIVYVRLQYQCTLLC